MQVEKLIEIIDSDFYTGVPDSQLKALCDYLMKKYGISSNHIIGVNEGNCTALAAGYYLSTGKIPVVYMQNSGIGNMLNPTVSLLNEKVYGIPCIFIIGWRGEPETRDEPQHVFQGEITIKLLEDLEIDTFIVTKDTKIDEIEKIMYEFRKQLKNGKSVAFVIRKGALINDDKIEYVNQYLMKREEIIEHIVSVAKKDLIVSTTGKASRELFEIREKNNQSHKYDFLTVGSMGHSASIALGIAMHQPKKKVWCIDGDGSILMHMGAMAVLGSSNINNLVHIVINNEAHETVGGMPTVASSVKLTEIAKGCGYTHVALVSNEQQLEYELNRAKKAKELYFIEVKAAIGARDDLGRPTKTAKENKEMFMEYVI